MANNDDDQKFVSTPLIKVYQTLSKRWDEDGQCQACDQSSKMTEKGFVTFTNAKGDVMREGFIIRVDHCIIIPQK